MFGYRVIFALIQIQIKWRGVEWSGKFEYCLDKAQPLFRSHNGWIIHNYC